MVMAEIKVAKPVLVELVEKVGTEELDRGCLGEPLVVC